VSIHEPRIFADEHGVWRENMAGRPFGIKWDEIYRVSAWRDDHTTAISVCVTLDFDWGECIELRDHQPGFDQVTEAISDRLPGINKRWFERVQATEFSDPPLEVWRRA